MNVMWQCFFLYFFCSHVTVPSIHHLYIFIQSKRFLIFNFFILFLNFQASDAVEKLNEAQSV